MDKNIKTLHKEFTDKLLHKRFSKKSLKQLIGAIMAYHGIKKWALDFNVEQLSADYQCLLGIEDKDWYSFTDIWFCKMNVKGAKSLGSDNTMFITEIAVTED